MGRRRTRTKLLLLVGVMGIAGVLAVAAVALLSRAMVDITRSDETASIFNVSADLDHELADAVVWLPDEPDVPREIPPLAREAITEVWLRAWSQPLILSDGSDPVGASVDGEATDGILIYFDGPGRVAMLDGADDWLGLPPHQISHDLRLTFYSEDGAIAAVTSERSRVLRALPVGDRVEWYETVETFEVVFVLSEKDWRIHHIVRTDVTGEWIAAEGPDPIAFTDEPVRSITWRPATQSATEFWSAPNLTEIESDLDQIGDLGFNTVRLELPFDELGGRDVESIPLQVAELFLDAAGERDLDVTLALLNGRTEHQPVNWDTDDRHILAVVQQLGDHPALALWELATAPDDDIGVERLDQSMMHAWLVHMSRTLRNVDDDTPLTVAFATPRAAAEAPPIADVISFAYPGSAEALATGVADVRSVWPDRPILLADMTASTRLSLLPGGMTEGEQARFYADALIAADEAGLAGFNVSTLTDFQVKTVALRAQLRAEEEAAAEEAAIAAREAEFPPAFDPEPTERGPEVHAAPIVAEVTWPTGSAAATGLIRVDGTRKPAADVFAPDADLDAVPTPSIVERATKPFNFIMLTLLALALGGWGTLVLWDRNLFPFSLLRRGRTTDAVETASKQTASTQTASTQTASTQPVPPPPTGEPDNSRPPPAATSSTPPPPQSPPLPVQPPPPDPASIGRNESVTATTHDHALELVEPLDHDESAAEHDDEPSRRRGGRVRGWFSRPALDRREHEPDQADPDTETVVDGSAPLDESAARRTPSQLAADLDPASHAPAPHASSIDGPSVLGPPPADLEPAWIPVDPLPSGHPDHDEMPLRADVVDTPQPPSRPSLLSEPSSASPTPSPDGETRSRSLAVDVLPQPRRAARPSVGDIAMLEVDLQAIDRALAYAPRPEIAPDLGRYAAFMMRTACIVTEECARTGGEPFTVEIEGHGPGRSVRVSRANEMRLTALARSLRSGDDREDRADRRAGDRVAVRVALSGSSDGRMIIAGSDNDIPTLTLVYLGRRTVTTTDSLGFQVSSEHSMGLITVAAGSTPVAADAYLARVQSILERRDWIGELE